MLIDLIRIGPKYYKSRGEFCGAWHCSFVIMFTGFSDVSKLWQIAEFEETGIEPMVLRLYEQIEPFYQQLHAYVRRRLTEVYRNYGMDPRGPIPAHILGKLFRHITTSYAHRFVLFLISLFLFSF